jgi:hypothetical protein
MEEKLVIGQRIIDYSGKKKKERRESEKRKRFRESDAAAHPTTVGSTSTARPYPNWPLNDQ